MNTLSKHAFVFIFILFYFVQFPAEAWAKNNTHTKPVLRKHGVKIKSAINKHNRSKKPAMSKSRKKRAAAVSHQRFQSRSKAAVKKTMRSAGAVRRPSTMSVHGRQKNSPPIGVAGKPSDPTASLGLSATAALVLDPHTSNVVFAKNGDDVLPIASLTKLMTAIVVIEAKQPMNEVLIVTGEDIDRIKHTYSRLAIGSKLTRANMLHIALMSSENRAASALGRNYPGGLKAFVAAMNAKAKELGMTDTHYVEPTGLSSENVSSARDLAKLVVKAHEYPMIQSFSTNHAYEVEPGGPALQYRNSNRLIANPEWDILLQKTGYISEAGRCLVMHTIIKGREFVMVLLNAKGKFSRASDATRIRNWLERKNVPQM